MKPQGGAPDRGGALSLQAAQVTVRGIENEYVINPGQSLSISSDTTTIIIRVGDQTRGIWDPAMYAPALPGVLVALATLLIGHLLSSYREKTKRFGELCAALKAAADEAAMSAMAAWRCTAGAERLAAIHDTKRKLQSLGIAATTLANATRRGGSIDLIHEVANLRRAATADPFEDPCRPSDDSQTGAIMAALSAITFKIDERSLRRGLF